MKSIEEDLADWANDRPNWQRSIVQQLCRNQVFDHAAIQAIADSLIADEVAEVDEVRPADIPGGGAGESAVRLQAIRELAGVNALASEQELRFAPGGLTVIYGDNGSGKSGYARVLREAVGARVRGEVLGDVFASSATDQQAVCAFLSGEGGVEQEWKWGEAGSPSLGQIHFYDVECGTAYISAASEVSYRPSALTVLDGMVAVFEAVSAELDSRLQENADKRPTLPSVQQGTSASKFLKSLSASTTELELESALELNTDARESLGKLLAEEARLKGSDPAKERTRLEKSAADLDLLARPCNRLMTLLSPEALRSLETLVQRVEALREAAKIASARDFETEPLPGVGGETWRTLWEAAKAYSESDAYHDHDFPVIGAGSYCLLCQQPIEGAAADRLRRFREFMTDTTEAQAAKAEADLKRERGLIAEQKTLPMAVSAALSSLATQNASLSSAVEAWLSRALTSVVEVLAWIDEPGRLRPAAVGENPAGDLLSKSKNLRDRAVAVDSVTFAAELATIAEKTAEVQAAVALSDAATSIREEHGRLIDRLSIEKAKRKCDTTGVTRTATKLTKDHVTRIVRDRFTRETERLRLRRITLDPTAGRKGSLQHRPSLLGASMGTVVDVLSEGEKTALGLAGFFTELAFDETGSAVVLDDPVTSLDHERRALVAQRLVEISQERQVVVFTHDVTFVGDLSRMAKEAHVDVAERWVYRKGERTGFTSDVHPWKAKDVQSRIHTLQAELDRMKRDRIETSQDEYEEATSLWGGRLSETWERAVSMEVANVVVDRGTSEVRPKLFRLFASITYEDNDDFQAGYGRASAWAARHDKAPEINPVPPEPDDMQAELDRLKNWTDRIKRYKNL